MCVNVIHKKHTLCSIVNINHLLAVRGNISKTPISKKKAMDERRESKSSGDHVLSETEHGVHFTIEIILVKIFVENCFVFLTQDRYKHFG